MLKKALELVFRFRYAAFVLAVGLSILGVSSGTQLPLRLSLSALLPDDRVSVREMKNVAEYVGGVGYFLVIIGPTNEPLELVKPFAEKLKASPDINYVFYEREEFILKDKALYLLSKKEFKDLKKNSRVLFSKGDSDGLGLGLESQEEKKERAREFFRDLRKKVDKPKHFLSADGRYAMLLAKPTFNSEDLKKSKRLNELGHEIAKEILPEGVSYYFAGRFADKVRDTKQIQSDMAKTGLISLIGLSIILLWGLGSFKKMLVTICGVLISLGWTIGIAKATVGQINILTGFLLAILGGLGVEYGIHLIRRYEQERVAGRGHKQAIIATYLTMGRTLFSAAITSSCAFLILALSDFRGFSELGIIAGLGILCIYMSYFLCFPAIGIILSGKPRFGKSRLIFGYYPANRKWAITVLVIAGFILGGTLLAEFEYDFRRMHKLSEESTRMNNLANELFGKSLTPAALLTKDREQALALQAWLTEPPRDKIIKKAISTGTIIPEDMASRHRQIRKLERRIKKLSDKEIEDAAKLNPDQVRDWLAEKPYKLSDLPEPFPSTFGVSERIVYAYPAENHDKRPELRRFTALMAEARQKFPGTQIGSDATVFSEIIDHIITDGKRVLLLFLLGAFIVFWLDFRTVRGALILELQLICGIAFLAGLMGLIGERFSILNVAMIPAVLAAGVDMGVHVRHRQLEGHTALNSARFVAQAVQLSMLTTMMGFGALFFAQAGILKGIAWISVLGQISMYLVCMIIFPVLKDGLWRKVRFAFSKA